MNTKKVVLYHILFLWILLGGCNASNEQANDPDDNSFESAERGTRASEVEYSDEVSVGEENLISTIHNFDMLGRLYEVARASSLTEELEQAGPYTLLAPANIAFERAKSDEVGDVPDSWSKEELEEVLASHLIKGSYRSTDLTDTVNLVAVNGNKIQFIDKDNLLQTDIEASNGIVHIIDTLLISPN